MEQVGAVVAGATAAGTLARAVPPGFAALLAGRTAGQATVSPAAAPGFAAAAAVPSATLGEMLRATLPGMVTAAPVPAEAPALAPAAVESPVRADNGRLLRPVQGRMSSAYGMRVHPVTGQHKMHTGVDFAAPTGAPIAAAAGGTVSFAGVRGGYGNLVIIDHPGGTQTYCAHASTMAVRDGDRVRAGEVVATVGATGLATGPHLHFELRRNGSPVDPSSRLAR